MSLGYYSLAVILHLTWPFRWKLNSNSEEKECHIVKEISCRPPIVEPSAPYPSPPYQPYPRTDGQEGNTYWAPNPSAPPPNTLAPQLPPQMVFSRGIDPSLIMPLYGDDPPTYEEVFGTGSGEGDSDGEGDNDREREGMMSGSGGVENN